MSLPIPAEQVAVGDFLTGYGTVTQVIENRDKDGKLLTIGFKFFNGEETLGLDPFTEFLVVQGGPGGLKERMPDSSEIRSDLKSDHPNGR